MVPDSGSTLFVQHMRNYQNEITRRILKDGVSWGSCKYLLTGRQYSR